MSTSSPAACSTRSAPGCWCWPTELRRARAVGPGGRTGADMAWRIKKNLVLPPVRVLPDGSFLSVMPTPAENLRLGQARARGKPLRQLPEGHLVRVIEYTVTVATADGRTRTEAFRLATTLLDHAQAPAAQLAASTISAGKSRTASVS